jgi:hypothetical protein
MLLPYCVQKPCLVGYRVLHDSSVPGQRNLLNMGKFDLSKGQWKLLADCIEDKVTCQKSLFRVYEHIENLATYFRTKYTM